MNEVLEKGQSPAARRIEAGANNRLRRMRFLSRLLDNSIPLPGGYRIGFDPIIGLAPGVGDLIASLLSLWLVYDAAILGLPKRILSRMILNIALETLIGAFPVLGDLLDAVWKANARNMELVELHYSPMRPERSFAGIALWSFAVLAVIWGLAAAGVYASLMLLMHTFHALFG
jgi:hypothetical protein